MKRTWIKRTREKPRPGRLKGVALAKLRAECFYRDEGRCVECGVPLILNADPIHERSFHMAHIRAKRIGGDSLDNVRALCGACHRDEHNGTKDGKFQHRAIEGGEQ